MIFILIIKCNRNIRIERTFSANDWVLFLFAFIHPLIREGNAMNSCLCQMLQSWFNNISVFESASTWGKYNMHENRNWKIMDWFISCSAILVFSRDIRRAVRPVLILTGWLQLRDPNSKVCCSFWLQLFVWPWLIKRFIYSYICLPKYAINYVPRVI